MASLVEDYLYGYPSFIDGAELAHPGDVGSSSESYEFLRVNYDESHPEHGEIRAWAKEQGFWE